MKSEQAITEDPMTDLVNAAFAAAAKEVIKRAIETGTPVIVWRNGSVMQLDPRELTQYLAESGQFRSKFLRWSNSGKSSHPPSNARLRSMRNSWRGSDQQNGWPPIPPECGGDLEASVGSAEVTMFSCDSRMRSLLSGAIELAKSLKKGRKEMACANRLRFRRMSLALSIIATCGGCQKQAGSVTPHTAANVSTTAGARSAADEVDALIEVLNGQNHFEGYATAEKLARFGATGVPKLCRGLESRDPETRKWCARALTNLVGGYGDYSGRPVADPILTALAKERNPGVAWYMVQAVEAIRPDPERAIPILINTLKSDSDKLQIITVEAIKSFGKEAAPAKSTLVGLLQSSLNDWLRTEILLALESIGFDSADATVLAKLDFTPNPRAIGYAVRILLTYPDDAMDFLHSHPSGLSSFNDGIFLDALVSVLKDHSPTTARLREYLLNRDDLPSIAMVHTGNESYLPTLFARIRNADPHSRTYLEACARALGAEANTVIKISAADAGGFKPKSAHPGFNKDRRAPEDVNHGDGMANVLITGKLVMSDGSPVKAPKLYAANDRMLLGQNRRDLVPLVRFDESTGRFVFETRVFAAFSIAKGQKEPGPYQTGTAKTIIVADGAAPLQVIFYDEMPDVEIILTAE